VKYGVIEAGLGGRLDATNVIPSKLTVLTSVGLDHTEWLGETLEEIAGEKLAVLRDHTTLIAGEVPDTVEPVIERELERRHAHLVRVAVDGGGDAVTYRDRNLALAESATEDVLGRLDADAVLGLQSITIPGRAELIPGDPPAIFDAAHNPDGARALAEALPELTDGAEVVCCLAVLEGKDVSGIVGGLAPACSQFVCTEIPSERIEGSGRPGGRARPALELAALCERAGVAAEAIPDPIDAWKRARELAKARNGVALAAGSHYLLSSLWIERPAQSS
jgi:dihydrofolate synthase/folylpolyglutamate synthase